MPCSGCSVLHGVNPNPKKRTCPSIQIDNNRQTHNIALFLDITYLCQCCIQEFFGNAVFFLFCFLGKPPIVVTEGPKIFDVQYIWGRIFVSLEKIFVFKYS